MNALLARKGRPHASERGSALLLSILVLLIVTAAGLALMFNTSLENTISGNETKVSKAFYAAESGIQYGAQKLASDTNWVGGPIPGGISSNVPGQTGQDLSVTVFGSWPAGSALPSPPPRPALVGYVVHPGDELQAQGSSYGSSQTVEAIYVISATATSAQINATKTITAQVGIYPQQLSIR